MVANYEKENPPTTRKVEEKRLKRREKNNTIKQTNS